MDNSITLPKCVKCQQDITAGHAYELGDDRWHTHCFSCYKCNKPLSCESNFLVLGTGSLICFDCSECCRKCGKKIDDMAIILSSFNEAYCSSCFTCSKCGRSIQDLKYAKTKKGLYCIKCHDKLVSKRKRNEEKKLRLKKDLPDIPVHSKDVDIQSRSDNVTEQYLEEEDTPETSTHTRNISIDDMLNSTLYASNSLEDDSTGLKSPLREKKNEAGFKSPASFRRGMILVDDNPDIQLAHNSDVLSSELTSSEDVVTATSWKNEVSIWEDKSPLTSRARTTSISNRNAQTRSSIGRKGSLKSLDPLALKANLDIPHDSYSGWGPQAGSINPRSGSQRQLSSKGQSDTLIYSTPKELEDLESNRKRSQSGSNSINRSPTFAMTTAYRTRPVEDDDQIELESVSKQLKDMKQQLRIITEKKKKILQEVDELERRKGALAKDVRDLYTEKTHLLEVSKKATSSEAPFSTSTGAKTESKPRFWKLFSSDKHSPHQSNGNNSIETSPQKLEISGPKLQNKDKISDMKLKSISPEKPATNIGDGENIYASSLVSRCLYEGSQVPWIVMTCIDYIETSEERMKMEGIYRKSGSQLLIEQIEKLISDQVGERDEKLTALFDTDVHAVAGVLKRYFRKLPNPLITYEVHEPVINIVTSNKLLEAEQDVDMISAKFSRVLQLLPPEHFAVLRLLMAHLDRLAGYSQYNLMTINNLALVFAPGIIRDDDESKDLLEMKERNYVIKFLIENHNRIFR